MTQNTPDAAHHRIDHFSIHTAPAKLGKRDESVEDGSVTFLCLGRNEPHGWVQGEQSDNGRDGTPDSVGTSIYPGSLPGRPTTEIGSDRPHPHQ